MEKEKKSARELATLVAERIGMMDVRIEVHPDPAYGWHPTVFTTPTKVVNVQNAAERAAQELRPLYELCDERGENDRRPLTRRLAVMVNGKEQRACCKAAYGDAWQPCCHQRLATRKSGCHGSPRGLHRRSPRSCYQFRRARMPHGGSACPR